MSMPAGYVLRLSEIRQYVFDDRPDESNFAQAVPEFAHSRNVPLVCFILAARGALTHIGLGRRGQRAGNDQRRLNIERLYELRRSISTNEILDKAPKTSRSKINRFLAEGGLLSPKSFDALVEIVGKVAPDTEIILRTYRDDRRRRIGSLSDSAKIALAAQKEAVATALTIAGIERQELQGWDYERNVGPTSFIAGLPRIRLREDQMIVNDLTHFPGYVEIKKTAHNATVFQNAQSRLTIVLANRLPLEQQTGADLIYYNETFKSFVMVQYKAMEERGGNAVFRFPNDQLSEEMQRMDSLLKELEKCEENSEADGYRFCENPFFLKFCPRITFDPDSTGLSKGMYLPLRYWKLLSVHEGLVGRRGGKSLSYRNVRRYLDNTKFATIVAGGWVGTNIAQSHLLEAAIRSTLNSGRAAVIAVNRELDDRHRLTSPR